MKIALIRRQYAATGGAELYLQRLIAGLAAAGHEVHLFAEKWEGQPTGVILHQVTVQAGRAKRPLVFAEAVAAMLREVTFDVVLSLERTVAQDVYRAGDGVHRVWLEQRRRYAPWWKRAFIGGGAFHRNMIAVEARTFDPKNTRHIIVNSDMVRREILQNFAFPDERIHLVRNGVDVARFQSGQRNVWRAKFGLKEDDFVLLFVGSGWERKGLSFLLKLIERWQGKSGQEGRMKLLVVGKGRKPRRVPDNVIFAGPLAEVEQAYAAADLLTFLPIYEPSSNVVTEALASGLPVITSAFNGAAELVEPGINGDVLAEPADTNALERAVLAWMNRPGCRPVPSRHALDIDTNIRETLRVLELAATEKRG